MISDQTWERVQIELLAQARVEIDGGEGVTRLDKRAAEKGVYALLELGLQIMEDARAGVVELSGVEAFTLARAIPKEVPEDIRMSLYEDLVQIFCVGN